MTFRKKSEKNKSVFQSGLLKECLNYSNCNIGHENFYPLPKSKEKSLSDIEVNIQAYCNKKQKVPNENMPVYSKSTAAKALKEIGKIPQEITKLKMELEDKFQKECPFRPVISSSPLTKNKQDIDKENKIMRLSKPKTSEISTA